MEQLTVAKARAITEPGRYRADPTLYLNVAPGGSKSWIQRVAIDGRRRDIGLGPFPVIGLAEARRRAFANRVAVAEGRDPLSEKHRAKAPTFREAAVRTFEANRGRWRNAKHIASWMQMLEKRALPVIGAMRVDQIAREDVLRILTPIWTRHPEVARKTRQRIRAVLAWAQAHGYVEHNAAGEGIDGALPTMPKQKRHYRALPYQEVAAALETIETSRASLAAKLCLRFVVLTAARSGEARAATWSEIDEDAGLWVIPAERMKTGTEHRQPLSRCSAGRARRGAQTRRWERARVPVADETRPAAVGHELDQGSEGTRDSPSARRFTASEPAFGHGHRRRRTPITPSWN